MHEKGNVLFPITKEGHIKKLFPEATFVNKKAPKRVIRQDYKEILGGKLTKKEFSLLPSSFDVVGDILILEVKEGLKRYEKEIAKALLATHKNLATVVKKSGIHEGEFRTQKVTVLAGKRKKDALYVENKARMHVNVQEMYFSPRLSSERLRIAQLVKPGEEVLVMFSGCAPYPLVIAKNSAAKEIVGIELNPKAHEYGLKNLELNKTKNITLIKGDVKKETPQLGRKFDRILMPLPKGAEDFLDTAIDAAKEGGIIHLYAFLPKEDIPQRALEMVERACAKAGRKHKMLGVTTCGQFSPTMHRICVDFSVGRRTAA